MSEIQTELVKERDKWSSARATYENNQLIYRTNDVFWGENVWIVVQKKSQSLQMLFLSVKNLTKIVSVLRISQG